MLSNFWASFLISSIFVFSTIDNSVASAWKLSFSDINIKKGGSTIRDFKNTLGDTGNFQKEFKVYWRKKLNCLRSNCTGVITKIVQSNRSTYLCKLCQK